VAISLPHGFGNFALHAVRIHPARVMGQGLMKVSDEFLSAGVRSNVPNLCQIGPLTPAETSEKCAGRPATPIARPVTNSRYIQCSLSCTTER
jgi:hypothetical protein